MSLVLSIPVLLCGQNSQQADLLTESVNEVIGIPDGLTDIEVDEEGNIFLLEPDNHRIYKYLFNTRYDSVLTIGGKGIGEEGFNYPSQIEVQNRQNTYVLDLMNRRLLLLNTNMKVTREYNFLEPNLLFQESEGEDIWPISFAAASTGELYILNQNDLKIYKLDTYGQQKISFGGLDYGGGSLEAPVQLLINPGNFLFASDTLNQTVTVYDLYGIFQYIIHPSTSFRYHRIAILDNYLVCLGKRKLYFENLLTRKVGELSLENPSQIVDVEATKDYFYILQQNKVSIHRYK